MDNRFLDKSHSIDIHMSHSLPHWNQGGKMQFLTFRLFDSLPIERRRELKEMKDNFISTHPRPWDNETAYKFWKIIGPIESKLMDNGYGCCILRNADIRKIVVESMKYLDSNYFDLVAYVIMPNHVHLLICTEENVCIENIISSLKKYTARNINKALGRSGNVWMKQYFDRIIRSRQHYQRCLNYIKENPYHLPPTDYELYFSPSVTDYL